MHPVRLRLIHRFARLFPTHGVRRSHLPASARLPAHSALLRLEKASGSRVRCLAGTVWLTEAGLARDVFLRMGEEWAVRGGGLTLVEVLEGGCVQVLAPDRGNATGVRARLPALAHPRA